MSYSWGAGQASAMTDSLPVVRPPVVRPSGADGASSGGGTDLRKLAAELAPMVEVWQRLLHLHVPDPSGCCRTCTKGGTGVPATSWPCAIHGVADLARRCHAGEPC